MKSYLFQHLFAEAAAPALKAELCETPLATLLELVHSTAQSGLVQLELFLERTAVPFEIAFMGGEIVGAALYDWHGLDALYSVPQDAGEGHLSFYALPAKALAEAGWQPLGPYEHIMGEWARLSDEWPRILAVLGSPSARFQGEFAAFLTGASARTAAHLSGRPLHSVAAQMVERVQAGELVPIGEATWHDLVLPTVEKKVAERSPHLAQLDGVSPLCALFGTTGEWKKLSAELLREIQRGWHPQGCGWLTRDLLWERYTAEHIILTPPTRVPPADLAVASGTK